MKCFASVACAALLALSAVSVAQAQAPDNSAVLPFARPQGPAAPPTVITFQDALDRARKIDVSVLSALADVEIAREDVLQAKAARLPSVIGTGQYTGTQGNGITPNGRFVGSDGVHVYRPMGTVREEISPSTILKTDFHKASAAQALANAKVDIARRGLDATVAENYYALVAAQRRYAATQQGVQTAQRFLDVTQQQERAGEAAHSDVVKAQLQLNQQRRGVQDALLAIEKTRLNLAVLLSPTLDENFTVVDDLDSTKVLPPFTELKAMAEKENPELKAADATVRQASFDVRSARNALLPSLTLEANYGMEANALKFHSTAAADPALGPLPNLGYFLTFNLSIPVFDWGSSRSKIRQAQTKVQQANLQLTQAQRQIAGNMYAFYNEAVAARAAVDLARTDADLAAESLRLINLRYQAGESTVLEVVDAQNTLIEVRNAYDDAQVRYRVAVTSLQALTGGF